MVTHTKDRIEPTFSLSHFLTGKGVTLVELLVAVALLSLLMVAFYTVFKGGTKAYETGEERVELIQNVRIAFERMVSEIRQAMPDVSGDTPDVVFDLEGGGSAREGRWITLYAPIDGKEGAEKIQFSRYSGEPGVGDETYTLYKRVTRPIKMIKVGEIYTYEEDTNNDGLIDNPGPGQPVTAAMPGTEGVVSYLYFNDRPPASRLGMLKITLTVKADPTDASDPGTTLHALVKAGIRYGKDLTGGF